MPAEPAPLTPDALFAALNAWVRSFDPGASGLVILYESHGMRGKIPVPFEGEDSEVIDDPSANLTVMEAAVLEVLRDKMKPGDVWSIDEIAKKAGFANTGKMRAFVKAQAVALKLKTTNRGWAKG